MAKIEKSKCIGCGACISICPNQAISIDSNDGKAIIDETKCINCGACASICPVAAPKIEK